MSTLLKKKCFGQGFPKNGYIVNLLAIACKAKKG